MRFLENNWLELIAILISLISLYISYLKFRKGNLTNLELTFFNLLKDLENAKSTIIYKTTREELNGAKIFFKINNEILNAVKLLYSQKNQNQFIVANAYDNLNNLSLDDAIDVINEKFVEVFEPTMSSYLGYLRSMIYFINKNKYSNSFMFHFKSKITEDELIFLYYYSHSKYGQDFLEFSKSCNLFENLNKSRVIGFK
ncbi:hypothetical protein [Moheibacter stercoris]|uniref:Phage abortive infection protein n=1 Tax=Moheibacter stercoris TaxID=1628251 RepID=A0ABV2LRH1_9FLAO